MWFGLQGIRDSLRGSRAAALAALVLVAFILQTAVTRGHFHFGSAFATSLSIQANGDVSGETTGKPVKAPSGHDESNCPLWHAGNICGTAVASVAVALFTPSLASARAPIDQRKIFVERFVAHWRSRAPPSL
jgi:hypothetical protein